MSINTDDLFLAVSQGNKNANEELFSWYIKLAFKIASSVAKVKGIYTYDDEEIYGAISELYQITLASFSVSKIPFAKYAENLLQRRIPTLLVRECIHNKEACVSLDSEYVEGVSLYDLVQSDDYENMISSINRDSNKQVIASSRFGDRKITAKVKQLLRYKEQGYCRKEIMKLMGISLWQYRYLQRLKNNNPDIINSFEMK